MKLQGKIGRYAHDIKSNKKKKSEFRRRILREQAIFERLTVEETRALIEDKRTPAELIALYLPPVKLAKLVADMAIDGSENMIKLCCEYVWGKPIQRTENLNLNVVKGIDVVFVDESKESDMSIDKEKTKEIEPLTIEHIEKEIDKEEMEATRNIPIENLPEEKIIITKMTQKKKKKKKKNAREKTTRKNDMVCA